MTMRDCPDGVMRDLLPVYAAGRLGAEQHAAVEGHLAACAECRAELELIRAVIRAYAVPVPDAAVIAAHIRPRRRVTGSVPFHRQPLWRVAATATLMIAASATYVAVRSGGGGPRAIPDSAARLVAGVDASRPDTGATPVTAAPLATGTSVRLGVSLADLTDAQLEALLAAMEGIEGNVLADPEVMAKPIIQGSDAEGGRN